MFEKLQLRCARIPLSFFLACCLSSLAGAETYQVGPEDDWFGLLTGTSLQSGDEVVLHSGVYSDSRRLSIRHRGSAERRIVIRGAEGEAAVFRRPDAKQNSLNLQGTQHLILRNLEITGGSSGIRISPHDGVQPRDVVLERLHIHHIAGVAVTCNHTGGDYSHMTFRQNHIHHTGGHGEGFYLGGNNESAIFHDSVIEQNYIHHLVGDHVSQGDGIELKQASYGNRVTGNVIHDTNYPGITVYGTEGRAPNEVTGNVVWNSNDHGIQAAADAVITDNLVADVRGSGIYSRSHQGAVPGNLVIRHNYVLVRSPAMALRIIRPSSSTDSSAFSGPIDVSGNTLVSKGEAPAVRINDDDRLTFGENRGVGNVEGLDEVLAAPEPSVVDATLPQLEGHPVWEHLDRADVVRQFSRF